MYSDDILLDSPSGWSSAFNFSHLMVLWYILVHNVACQCEDSIYVSQYGPVPSFAVSDLCIF